MALGFEVVRALGPFDVGQAVVVAEGRVVAIEGAEGTDGMLGRLRAAGALAAARAGVLVKRPKPGQELRIDMPAIGPDTVRRAGDAGLTGIAVLADGALAAERSRMRRSRTPPVFSCRASPILRSHMRPPPPADWRITARAGTADPARRKRADATKGADVLAALAALSRQPRRRRRPRSRARGRDAARVPRRVFARAGGLRQWGRARPRAGRASAWWKTMVICARLVAVARDSGACGPRRGRPPSARAAQAAVEEADRLGLFLAALTPSAGPS